MEGWDGMVWKGRKERNLRLWASEVRTKCNLAFTRWQKTSDMKNYHPEWKWMKKSLKVHSSCPHTPPSLPHERGMSQIPISPRPRSRAADMPWDGSAEASAFPSSGMGTRLGLFHDLERRQSMLAAEVKAAYTFTHGLLQKHMVFCFSRQYTVGEHSWWDMSLTFKRLWEFEKVTVPLTQSVLNILVVKLKF